MARGAGVEKSIDRLRRAAEPALRRLLHLHWRFSRGLTLGVRAVVIDAAGKVFLVRHSYVSGWHLPGGGVDHYRPCAQGETAGKARVEVQQPAQHRLGRPHQPIDRFLRVRPHVPSLSALANRPLQP